MLDTVLIVVFSIAVGMLILACAAFVLGFLFSMPVAVAEAIAHRTHRHHHHNAHHSTALLSAH